MDNNEKTTLRGITVAVGYGWQKFNESEVSSKDKRITKSKLRSERE